MRFGQKMLDYFNVTWPRKLNSTRLQIPMMGGIKVGISGEPFLLQLFGFFLSKTDGPVIDVGANIGQTLVKIKSVDPDQKYYGFEPNPTCFAYLERLTRANQWDNVTFFPCAVSDSTSIETLHITSGKPTDSKGMLQPTLNPTIAPDRTRKIVVVDYAEVDKHIEEKMGLLKIDVEGAELDVVKGMLEAIKRDKPFIFIELWPYDTLAERRKQVISLLQSAGYRVYVVEKLDNKRLGGWKAVDENHKPTQEMHDYFAIPIDREDLLDDLKASIS